MNPNRHPRRQRRDPRQQGGSAFLLALIVIVLLTLLGVSIVLVTETEMVLGHTEKTVDRQVYAAETGLWAQIAGLVLTNSCHHERIAIPVVPDTGNSLTGKQLAHAINTTKPLSLDSGCPPWTDCGEDLPENEQLQAHFMVLGSTALRVTIPANDPFDPDDPDTFETPFVEGTVEVNDARLDLTKKTTESVDRQFELVDNVEILGRATVATGFLVSPLRFSPDIRKQETDCTQVDLNSGHRLDPPPPISVPPPPPPPPPPPAPPTP